MFAAAGPGSSAIGGSFEASDPHFDSRIRDPFTLTNSTRRDLYRDDRGRRVDRTYHHRRSRSSHSSQSRHPSPQRTAGQNPKTSHSPKRTPLSPGRGPRSQSRSRSSSSDSVSSTSSTGSGRCDIFLSYGFHVYVSRPIDILLTLFLHYQVLHAKRCFFFLSFSAYLIIFFKSTFIWQQWFQQHLKWWLSGTLCSVFSHTCTDSVIYGDWLWWAPP